MSYHIRHCWLILLVFVLGITLPWTTAAADNNHMRQPISWVKSSETVPYPELNGRPNLWVKVSLKGNRTYIYSGKKLLYTMYSSAGAYQKDPLTHKMVSATPTGTFATSNIRMDRVYNPNLRLGPTIACRGRGLHVPFGCHNGRPTSLHQTSGKATGEASQLTRLRLPVN